MSYFNTCPACGCTLDPGERCDCIERGSNAPRETKKNKKIIVAYKSIKRADSKNSLKTLKM